MKNLSINEKQTQGLTSGAAVIGRMVLLSSIRIDPVFHYLIPREEEDIERIAGDMKINGYDRTKPITIWKEKGFPIDGGTRYEAAKRAGLYEVSIIEKSFESEQEAMKHAIKEQLDRRNLNEAGKLLLIEKLDNLKKSGRPITDIEEEQPKGKSSEQLATTIGMSARTIERGRAVLKSKDEEMIGKVKSGEMSINKAYNAIKKKEKPEEKADPIQIAKEAAIDDIFESENISPPTSDIPYQRKNTLYDEIMKMDLHHLAAYLESIQNERLSIAAWEEKLNTKY